MLLLLIVALVAGQADADLRGALVSGTDAAVEAELPDRGQRSHEDGMPLLVDALLMLTIKALSTNDVKTEVSDISGLPDE